MAVVQNIIKDEAGHDVAIYIEVDEKSLATHDPYSETRGASEQAREAFQKATELIRTCAENIASSIHSVPEKIRPKEFEVQFAIKIDTQVGALIAKSSTEAQLQVTLRWGGKEP